MKKISEMTLTELQDYAVALEDEKKQLQTQLDTANNDNNELRETNLALQDRNNKLFLQVEQTRLDDPQEPAEEIADSCEDFALKNINSIMKGF